MIKRNVNSPTIQTKKKEKEAFPLSIYNVLK